MFASFDVRCGRRIREKFLEENNAAIYKRFAEISRETTPTEKASRLLMAAERERLLELNTRPRRLFARK
jgi:hypothetical protein